MRVLMTGHQGYIGTVMAPLLAEAGHDVAGLDSGLFVDCVHGPSPEVFETVRVDLRDVQPAHLEGFDAVVHLAALSNDPLGDVEPEHTYAINHRASTRLAELAKVAGVTRFLYSSSCSVYGASDVSRLVDETAPMEPVTPYAESKIQVENDLHALADGAFSPVYLRNATAYGWSPRLRLDLVVNDLVARAHLTGEIVVLSDGTPWRPLVHVEDISRAFLACLVAPREAIHDESFNVGSEDENYQIAAVAEIIADVVSGSVVKITGETGGDPRSYRVDFSKIREHLPTFETTWTVERGARELHEAFSSHGLADDGPHLRYRRLAWLQHLRREGRVESDLRVVST